MPCNKCSKLPQVNFDNCQVYLYVPTEHHVEPIEEFLKDLNIGYSFFEDYFIFLVEDYKTFVEKLGRLGFNALDQKDIRLLPMSKNQSLSYEALQNLKTLKAWLDFYAGETVIDVLAHERVVVHFQPIIDVSNQVIYGYEALSRGIDENGHLISPQLLFSKAKTMGLLFFLDRFCREKVIESAAALGIKEKLFINFLPSAIYNPKKCLKTTDQAVAKTSLKPNQITFEVVETEYIEDFDHLNKILDYYKEKGYSTALDDLGSGYANKMSLMSISPDYMKIDMKIIQGIHSNKLKQRKLREYLEISEVRNIRPLAEGIENKEDLKYVMDQGVELVQGYYFAKPSENLVTLDLEKLIP